MVKTHMFVNGAKYASPLECLADIYGKHGVRGLFRGWVPGLAGWRAGFEA